MTQTTNFFLGANSGEGFQSLYSDIVDLGETRDFLVLKGGAGVGKSTFMKQVGKAAQQAGLRVEYIWCSGDPESLDAVLLPDCRAAIADGTSPHEGATKGHRAKKVSICNGLRGRFYYGTRTAVRNHRTLLSDKLFKIRRNCSIKISIKEKNMCRIFAITNSKGGVGKTTTCANLGAALSAAGKRVLLVDNDPQGDLTKVMRSDPKTLKYTLASLMNAVLDETELELFADKAVIKEEGVHYIPANSKLAGVSSRLVALQMSSRYRGGDAGGTPCELVMAQVLKLFQDSYDYILIDCGHSMDLLTINALAAAHQAIVPVQAHYLAMEDMADTLEVIQTIRRGINPKLAVGGILLTMYQGRTNLCRSIQDEIQADYGSAFTVFSSPIDFSIRVAEHPIGAASIFEYEPNNPAAKAYSEVAKEVLSYAQE